MKARDRSISAAPLAWCGWVSLALAGCGGDSPAGGAPEPEAADGPVSQLFTDVTASCGVRFSHGSGATGDWILTEIMGGGGALFDMDGDGDLDLFLLQGGTDPGSPRTAQAGDGHALFRNDGAGAFTDVSAGAGFESLTGYAMGAAAGDVDGDGDVDLYVSQQGSDALFLNGGDGRFQDATSEWSAGVEGWSTSAAFGDLDADGDLDLYVARYIELDPKIICNDAAGRRTYCPPGSGAPVHDVLLINEGGSFRDASAEAGLVGAPAPGLGVVIEDLTGDGRLDVYVANDGQANQLWVPDGEGGWRDEGSTRGIALNQNGFAEASMGVVVEDLDRDGLSDLFMTHLQEETHTLYRARGAGAFSDRTGQAGLGVMTRPNTGFGVAAFDVELDGDLDLAIANGRVRIGPVPAGCELEGAWAQLAEGNSLLVAEGARFTDEKERAAALTGPLLVDRCVFQGDLDGDGDVDLVVTGTENAARVLRNDAPREGSWVTIDPRLDGTSATGLGVQVKVTAPDFELTRTTRASDGYQSSRDPRAHFGVPGAPDGAPVDVELRWTDGLRERFAGLETGKIHRLVRGSGEAVR